MNKCCLCNKRIIKKIGKFEYSLSKLKRKLAYIPVSNDDKREKGYMKISFPIDLKSLDLCEKCAGKITNKL